MTHSPSSQECCKKCSAANTIPGVREHLNGPRKCWDDYCPCHTPSQEKCDCRCHVPNSIGVWHTKMCAAANWHKPINNSPSTPAMGWKQQLKLFSDKFCRDPYIPSATAQNLIIGYLNSIFAQTLAAQKTKIVGHIRDIFQKDFPTAFKVMKKTDPTQHHEKCSYRTQNRAILCDCAAEKAFIATIELRTDLLERIETEET